MKLKDIFEKPLSGEWGTGSSQIEECVPIIRTTNFKNTGKINYDNLVYRKIDVEKKKEKLLKNGDIIIEKSGGSPLQPVGRVVYFDLIKPKEMFTNNFTAILRPRKNIFPRYAFYLLRYLYSRNVVLKFQNKTTGIINLKLNDYLEKIEIQIPILSVQKKIADILDLAFELIEKRKEQIDTMDDLIQSIFYEMFGHPLRNEKNFFTDKIENISNEEKNSIKSGPFGSALKKEFFSENGYKIYGQEQVIKNNPNLGNYYINEVKYNELINYKVLPNDILISLVGTFGKMMIVPKDYKPGIINPRLMKLSLNFKKMNPTFFVNYFRTKEVLNKVKILSHGGTMGIINTKIMKEYSIICPPIELQNKFASIVEEIEAQKKVMEESLHEMENNFNALMQKKFNGELYPEE